MNLFYENYPDTIVVCGEVIRIVTDFREYIRLLDMLNDDNLKSRDKVYYLKQYFLEKPEDISEALEQLTNFILMKVDEKQTESDTIPEKTQKEVYSFEYDFPFIFSAFLSEYRINLRTVPYMHWWEFKSLFEGLSSDTEIKQRIMYRSIDLNDIKDKNERKRIQKIQNAIRLPKNQITDYEIGDAFGW